MDGSSVELVEEAKAIERAEKTPEELVAKAIAPVKREFLRPPPLRPCNDVASDSKSTPSTFVKEKKSKRQLKRERRQVLLSLSETSCTYIKQLRFWVLRRYYLFVLVRMWFNVYVWGLYHDPSMYNLFYILCLAPNSKLYFGIWKQLGWIGIWRSILYGIRVANFLP